MAVIKTNTNLSAIPITAGEVLDIRNGATLTIDSTPSVLPGTITCITSGKLRIENNSTTTPIRVPLLDMNRDFRFEGNGIFEVRGQMMDLGTGTGAAQSFNFASLYSGVINDVTYVEVETASGSGEYTPWPIVPIDPKYFHVGRTDGGGSQSEFLGTPWESGKLAFWHDGNKTLSFGDNVNGWSVPSGCKIRIPNILITNAYATDATLVHAIISEGTPTGGTFTITITNRATGVVLGTTSSLAFNATTAQIDTAIEAITGVNTVTSGGGALPTAVSITWAGSLASTPLALTVNSSVTGGTDSVIYTREWSAANMTLVDLNPSGTLDAENCMFSQKIRFGQNDAFSSIRMVGVGVGADMLRFINSNGKVNYHKVSFSVSPYVVSSYLGIDAVLGEVSLNKVVNTTRRSGQNFQVTSVPNVVKADNLTCIQYYATNRSVSNRTVFNIATVSPNLVFNNIVGSGGRLILTNLTNNIWNNVKMTNDHRSLAVNSGNAISLFQTSNCVNQVFLNPGMSGTAGPRNYLFSSDINSSNIEVIGGVLDGGNNALGLVNPNGKTIKVKNTTVTGIRTGGIVVDQPSTFTASGVRTEKVFATVVGTQSTSGLDAAQDAVFDLVSSDILGITEGFASVENYVGGNFASLSITPTTGHVTFGPVGRGTGYTPTGSTYTSQTGFVSLQTANDSVELEIPFAMHGITGFQNVEPLMWIEGAGVVAQNYVIRNEGGITGGTFTLTLKNASGTVIGTTTALAFNAGTSTVDAALEAIAGVGSGKIAVSGSLSAGYVVTFTGTFAGQSFILEVDGSLLTGGTLPNVAYAYGRSRLLTGEKQGTSNTLDFALATATGTYGAYQTLNATNLQSAFTALTGYSANDGLKMKVKLVGLTDDPYRTFTQLSMPTNINPSLWVLTDSNITLNGPLSTDVVEIRSVADNSLLYTLIGGGNKQINVGANYGLPAYFVRKNAVGIELMRTQAEPFTFSVGNLGTFNLFAGAEVQVAQAGRIELLPTATDVWAHPKRTINDALFE